MINTIRDEEAGRAGLASFLFAKGKPHRIKRKQSHDPPFSQRLVFEEKSMDEDVIDLSKLSEEDRREHFRRLEQLTTCPCCYCQKICDRVDIMADCEPYQAWLDYQMPRRRT